MKILVTGGAGFIGSHVVDACVAEDHSVTVLDDLSTGRREQVHPKAEFVQMDVRDEGIGELFRKKLFDVVIHQAAQMDVRKSVDDPIFDAQVNIQGSINLLEQCRSTGVRRFIFASTGGAIYGEQDYFPADENHPTRPISPYGISKLAIEKYLYYYSQVYGLRHVILRYANVYGPRQNPHGEAGVVAIFAQRMLAGQQPIINGEGTQTRDYVFVGDVVRANVLALQYEESACFNVGTGVETTVNDLFKSLRQLTQSPCKEVHGPPKKGEQERSVIDASCIHRVLGWSPKVTIGEGLRQTVEFFRNSKVD